MITVGVINCDDCVGTLTIDGVGLNDDPRWCAYDLSVIWTDLTKRGGDGIVIPGAPGVAAVPHLMHATRYLLPFAVTGHVDAGGTIIGPVGAELRCKAAIEELRGLIVSEPGGFGTRTLIYESDNTWTAEANVIDLRRAGRQQASDLWDGDLEIILTDPWVVT